MCYYIIYNKKKIYNKIQKQRGNKPIAPRITTGANETTK